MKANHAERVMNNVYGENNFPSLVTGVDHIVNRKLCLLLAVLQ